MSKEIDLESRLSLELGGRLTLARTFLSELKSFYALFSPSALSNKKNPQYTEGDQVWDQHAAMGYGGKAGGRPRY